MKVETAISILRREGWEVIRGPENEAFASVEAKKKGHRKISCLAQRGEITSFKVESCSHDNSSLDGYNSTWVGSLNRAVSISQIWKET
jgi:hypothetical protein